MEGIQDCCGYQWGCTYVQIHSALETCIDAQLNPCNGDHG